jgi:hypothetical protein
MNTGNLLREFRNRTKDTESPYFIEDDTFIHFLDEAQKEAAIRGRLLRARREIELIPGEHCYPLSDMDAPPIHEIIAAHVPRRNPYAERCRFKVVSEEWRMAHGGKNERYLVQEDTKIFLYPTPEREETLVIEGYRLPRLLKTLNDHPEIHPSHHVHLLDWAIARAHEMEDADTQDLQKASVFDERFTRYFGLPVDVDLRRATRRDEPQHTEAFWV